MNVILSKLQSYTQKKFFRFGVPFLVLIVAGSFGLKQFAQLRYTYSKKGTLTQEEAEKHGLVMKKPEEVTLETEFEKIKALDIDNWESVRGPRPWEDETMQQRASH
ncbi:cytochrome c oxidase assembly protein COX16 homolog, mitochondrial [Toxorhynchites rutilus septentrionalis]|uniref:cytochrome c oxidase assembly protein COX16 homolog, mitochondrial n=1 Tax=Toxorhynchites rutilus septentrionalis TaxID=329112 RepID=UPI002479DADD|nr:cytochrome c oxidase assembly protein COX16 homolog, mitochondrial [Toxorhynchites rutilus septentrionalis]